MLEDDRLIVETREQEIRFRQAWNGTEEHKNRLRKGDKSYEKGRSRWNVEKPTPTRRRQGSSAGSFYCQISCYFMIYGPMHVPTYLASINCDRAICTSNNQSSTFNNWESHSFYIQQAFKRWKRRNPPRTAYTTGRNRSCNSRVSHWILLER